MADGVNGITLTVENGGHPGTFANPVTAAMNDMLFGASRRLTMEHAYVTLRIGKPRPLFVAATAAWAVFHHPNPRG
jgi:hypothetical protein